MIPASDQLLLDLSRNGVDITKLDDLLESEYDEMAALPVLLDWIQHANERVPVRLVSEFLVTLVDAVAFPQAHDAAMPILYEMFMSVQDTSGYGLRWAIGRTLATIANDDDFDDLERIICDKRFGKARQMVVLYFSREANPKTVPLLIRLLEDEDVNAFAATTLGALHAKEAKEPLTKLLHHPNQLVKREAKRALARLKEQDRTPKK